MYLHPFSSKASFHSGCHITLRRVPCAISRSVLVTHFKYRSVYSLIPIDRGPGGLYSPQGCQESDTTEMIEHAHMHMPIPNSLTIPCPHASPDNHKFLLEVCDSVSVLKVSSCERAIWLQYLTPLITSVNSADLAGLVGVPFLLQPPCASCTCLRRGRPY